MCSRPEKLQGTCACHALARLQRETSGHCGQTSCWLSTAMRGISCATDWSNFREADNPSGDG
eukprot:3176765-Karenia_brevis.AAC.1